MPLPMLRIVVGALLTMGAALPASAAVKDPLDVPALPSARADRSLLLGLANAGPQRLVAVGPRGHVLVSDDQGKQWKQGKVPVSTDLVAVHFPTAELGWAVGHGGVVLHSADGGRNWVRQLDGKQAAALAVAYYEKRLPSTDAALLRSLDEAKRYAQEGAIRPFLDVWFDNAQVGYVVGTFNMILRTTDGGKSWEPWSDRVDNERALHLHAVRAYGGTLYLAGEQGLLLKLDPAQGRFVALDSGYQGTFFGLAGNQNYVVAYGLRGNAVRSTDQGRTWSRVATQVDASITSGTVLADGRLVLGTAGGHLLVSGNGGDTFTALGNRFSLPLFGLAPAGAGLAIVGPTGARFAPLQ